MYLLLVVLRELCPGDSIVCGSICFLLFDFFGELVSSRSTADGSTDGGQYSMSSAHGFAVRRLRVEADRIFSNSRASSSSRGPSRRARCAGCGRRRWSCSGAWGMPEAFREGVSGPEGAERAPELVLGVGLVEGGPRTYTSTELGGACNAVIEPCEWEVVQRPADITMTCRHNHGGTVCELIRKVSLEGETVTSTTTLTNLSSAAPLSAQWYAHPFFPRTADGSVCTFSRPPTLGVSAAFLQARAFRIILSNLIARCWPRRTAARSSSRSVTTAG